jgi:hypothetical protein
MTVDELIHYGLIDGLALGIHDDGYNEGYQDGNHDGNADGFNSGLAKGRRAGWNDALGHVQEFVEREMR